MGKSVDLKYPSGGTVGVLRWVPDGDSIMGRIILQSLPTILLLILITSDNRLFRMSGAVTDFIPEARNDRRELDIGCSVNISVDRFHRHRHPPSCSCNVLHDIFCSNLEVIPRFHVRTEKVFEGLYMIRQGIHELPQDAFSGIRVKKLSLNFNPIRDVISESAFGGLGDHLLELHLGRCKIRTLPTYLMRELDQLTHLHLWANNILHIPPAFFKNLRNLQELLLWGNSITEVDENTFAGLWKLRRLDLDRNHIKSLNKEVFRHLSELRLLYLGENNLHAIYSDTFEYMKNLKILNLDGNGLGFLYPRTFQGLNNLLSLALHRNEISFIQENMFSHLHNLLIIWLSNNKLQTIWPKTFGGLESLLQIHLCDNSIKVLPDGVFRNSPNLTQLYLDGNQLQGVGKCAAPSHDRINVLSLVGNPLDCDCRLAWLAGIHESGGILWGTCGTDLNSTHTGSIVESTSYRLESCEEGQLKECFLVCKTSADTVC